MRNLLLACLVCLAVSKDSAGEPPLTLGEMESWKIVCGPAAIESESFAASEFQALFRELTGIQLPIEKTIPE